MLRGGIYIGSVAGLGFGVQGSWNDCFFSGCKVKSSQEDKNVLALLPIW